MSKTADSGAHTTKSEVSLAVSPFEETAPPPSTESSTARPAVPSPILASTPTICLGADPPICVYVAEGCEYFSKPVGDTDFDDKSFDPPALVIGERLEVLAELGGRYKVRTYAGKSGIIAKRKVQAEDPKTYFTATVGGRKVVGFLRGPSHCSFIDRFQASVDTGGKADIPIPRILKLQAGPDGLRVWSDDGMEYSASVAQWKDSWGGCPARFYYGQLPAIKSGAGIELPIAHEKITRPLLLERLKVE